jgi:hypothetical protein
MFFGKTTVKLWNIMKSGRTYVMLATVDMIIQISENEHIVVPMLK